MLAGCSSSALLSPRHRLRNEVASTPFQACHFPSMSTQRLDLPCNFPRSEASRPQQPIRPVNLSVESKIPTCPLKHNVKEELWGKGKSLKRFAEHAPFEEESCFDRAKRKKQRSENKSSDSHSDLSIGQLVNGNFWFRSGVGLNPQVPFSISSSGDEERVCFVPGDVISPPLPLPNAPWIDSVVTEITKLGDKNVEASHRPVQEASGSSTSPESSDSLTLKLHENPSGLEIGNGSGPSHPAGGGAEAAAAAGAAATNHREEEDGFELIRLLVACVEAIGSKSIAEINNSIARLGDLASPRGSSPITRLTSYYVEALALRITRFMPHIFHVSPPRDLDRADDNGGTALRLLNQVTPIPKFIHFTSNEILLRAFENKDRVHIIDFDIKQGLQWPPLFQSLASRPNPPSHVRITGIGESKQDLIETGERLSGFAEALNLRFEFHPVVDRLEDVRLWMLHVKEKETVAVNCISQLHKLLYDPTRGAIRDFLGLIRSTNPEIVIMAEQEAEHNEPTLESRLSNSLKYYSAIFDSIDSTNLPLDSPVRSKIEDMFGREIRNMIACEGSERVERHEGFMSWRKTMEEGGFRNVGISERELIQSQMLMKMYNVENYRVDKEGIAGDRITLRWEDQSLFTVSAWKPEDGSSTSQARP
ncbi:hypothetical protein NMG60_11030411 [Bertholletia excelsa]